MTSDLKSVNQPKLKIKINSQTLITVFVILFIIFGTSTYLDYRARKTSVINSMVHFSKVLSKTIQKSINTYIISRKVVEHFIDKKNYATLKVLDNYELIYQLNNDYLTNFSKTNQLFNVDVYDSLGKPIYFSHGEYKIDSILSHINPILTGHKKELSFTTLINNKQSVFGFSIPRSKGGAIVGSIPEKRINAIRNVANIDVYLETIAKDSSIQYISIQDSMGVIANTSKELLPLNYATIYQSGKVKTQFHWRLLSLRGKKLVECLFPISISTNRSGICRIGLDYTPIDIMHKEVLYQTLIRLSILLIIGFFLFSYYISTQNYNLLEKEKVKITNEIIQLQTSMRQKEKMIAVGEFAAGIAHEIRNPLNAISMTTQRINKEYLANINEDGHESLIHIIRDEIDRINKSIEQFLQFSRPLPLQLLKFNIDKIIDNVVQLYKKGSYNERINFIWENQGEVISFVDPGKIEDCLINIIENAIVSIKTLGDIKLNLTDNSNEIRITIEDTGIGIPEKILPKIFNLYFTTKSNGNGLGLAHVHQIISEHGGKIDVESKENSGTKFKIILPKENI